jgi:cupin fold WbuC family metalloprotein
MADESMKGSNSPGKLAFPNVSGALFRLTDAQITSGLVASRMSRRLRMVLPVHRVQEAEVQRIVNFLQPGTYIRPHKHPLAHASESIVLLQGSIRFFTFNDRGEVVTDHKLRATPVPDVADIEPGVWHSFLVLEKDTILFECKKGPYNAETDKVFASWAPEEGSESAAIWMKEIGGI